MQNYSDLQTIIDYLKGDEKSLEILIRRYFKMIYSFIYRYVGDAQDAEDITQEVFVKVWRNLKTSATRLSKGFDPSKGSFKTWIFSIAKNSCVDFLKKRKTIPFSRFFVRGGSAIGGDADNGDNLLIDTLADPSPLPQEILEKADLARMLNSIMEKLPSKYRMILFLRYNDHFTFREISESLGEPLNTVKSRHGRALVMLKKFLSESSPARLKTR